MAPDSELVTAFIKAARSVHNRSTAAGDLTVPLGKWEIDTPMKMAEVWLNGAYEPWNLELFGGDLSHSFIAKDLGPLSPNDLCRELSAVVKAVQNMQGVNSDSTRVTSSPKTSDGGSMNFWLEVILKITSDYKIVLAAPLSDAKMSVAFNSKRTTAAIRVVKDYLLVNYQRICHAGWVEKDLDDAHAWLLASMHGEFNGFEKQFELNDEGLTLICTYDGSTARKLSILLFGHDKMNIREVSDKATALLELHF